MDPKHKSMAKRNATATKISLRRQSSNAHPQSPTTAKRAKRFKQDNGERNMNGKKDSMIQAGRESHAVDITLPAGAGLVEDGKKLFAVQHRGALYLCCGHLSILSADTYVT